MKPNTARIVVTIFVLLALTIRVIWPESFLDTTALILLGFLVLIWFGQILFKSMTFPGGLGVEFQEDKAIKVEAKAKVEMELKQTTEKPSIRWDKVSTLFWLGNDLMWIEDMTYRYAGPERVLEGLENALSYLKDLGFADKSFPVQELTNAKIMLQSVGELSRENYKQMLQGLYQGTRQYVETVKFYIHSLANIQQPGFNKLRVS